jgi:FMN phosphatase YigB (HAD superfamily)
MAKTLLEYRDWLDERKLRWPAAPKADPAKATPFLNPLPGIKAVAWNVYGTLLRIADGELLHQHPQAIRMEVALDKTIQEFNMWNSMTRKPGKPSDYMGQKYNNVVDEQRMASSGRKGDITEVDSAKVWLKLLGMLDKKDYQYDASLYGSMEHLAEKVAYFFHASLQGTEAAPHAHEALLTLSAAGFRQGIIADGQVFTVAQLVHALRVQGNVSSSNGFFQPELNTLSYVEGIRKPSKALFLRAMDRFNKAGLDPSQVLYISSRVRDDLSVAKSLNMRTALYAAEKLGLHATPDDMKDPELRPDRLITDLNQVRDLVGA